jgi:nucleotide-binding universal stress UspA family protein
MEKQKRFLVVTWDFTPLSEMALAHAVKISRMVDTEIRLLHILGKKDPPDREEEIASKLQVIAEKNEKETRIETTWVILRGKIFSEISKYASDEKANMVIMGTHGIQGSQKFFGSWAMRVMLGSKVPFLVVQAPPKDMEKYQNIVFPVDFRIENRGKLKMAIFMGKYFDSKVHILKQAVTDKSLVKKTNTNLNFAVKYLLQNNIAYEIHEVEKGQHLGKETLAFTKRINADLIIILTSKQYGLVVGSFEQYIIANSLKVPVMCINPKAIFVRVGSFQYG